MSAVNDQERKQAQGEPDVGCVSESLSSKAIKERLPEDYAHEGFCFATACGKPKEIYAAV